MLAGSDTVVNLWWGKQLVGFGRATSDGFSRAVLWGIVVAGDLQGNLFGAPEPTMPGVCASEPRRD